MQPRPSQQLVADVRSGMERLVVEYATESMLNIVPGRNSDLGSSCCAFFAARWGSRVMQAVSMSQRVESLLTLGAVQQMLAACVSEYDNRGAVDGSFPIESFQEETKRLGRGAEVVVRERVVTEGSLAAQLSGLEVGDAAFITGMPLSLTNLKANWVGDTFCVVSLVEACSSWTSTTTYGIIPVAL